MDPEFQDKLTKGIVIFVGAFVIIAALSYIILSWPTEAQQELVTSDEIFTGPGWHDYSSARLGSSFWSQNQTDGALCNYDNSSSYGLVQLEIFRSEFDCQQQLNNIIGHDQNVTTVSIMNNATLYIWNTGGYDCFATFMSGTKLVEIHNFSHGLYQGWIVSEVVRIAQVQSSKIK